MVIRIGAMVHPDPDPDRGLSRIAGELGADTFAEWVREYHAGRWMLVCLEMFADVLNPHGVRRVGDGSVRSLYFGVPHGEDNVAHAREAIAKYAGDLAGTLRDTGIAVTADDLGRLPMVVELDPEIAERLSP
jgi:hypothetical protein